MANKKEVGPMSNLDFGSWIREASQILESCQISIHNFERISTPNGKYEEFLLSTGFFAHLRWQYEAVLTVELNKLYAPANSSTERWPFSKVLRKLVDERWDPAILVENQSGNSGSWKGESDFLESLEQAQILLAGVIETSSCVVKYRHSEIAHWTKKASSGGQPTLVEFRTLINVGCEIINLFNKGYYGAYHMFDVVYEWSVDDILRWLGEREEWRNKL